MKAVHLRHMALHLGLAVVVLALAGCPRGPQLSANVEMVSDVVYALGYVGTGDQHQLKELLLDILAPNDLPGVLKPAVLVIHGGSFDGGTKTDEDLVQYADGLATRGYVCFLSDYRLTQDNPPAPGDWAVLNLGAAIHAATVDAKAAMRYIRANSAQFEIDPDRISIMGDSAGAIAAIAAGISDPEDFASDGPGYDVPAENNPGLDARPRVIIDFWGSATFVLDEFDKDDPPILVAHGTSDFTVGVTILDAYIIENKCKEFDIPYRFYPLWGEGHGAWDADVDGMNLVELSEEFLRDYVF